jgi:hypothetical protein
MRASEGDSGKGIVAETDHGDPDRDFVALRVGQAVGRYRIAAVLGRGGFGITYRALDAELGREVALKEYLPAALAVRQDGTTVVPISTSAAQDYAWGRDRFVAEGRTLAALHRVPGIVLVHDFLEANGTAYLVMELLGGQTLQDRVARHGPLDAAAFERLLSPLLEGLEQVHAAGFLHRDVKPANILLDQRGQPTLIDFGASRAAVAGRTQAMTAVFTPGYAAVEQFTAATQGPWTDIYGLAATLHFAITGSAPPNAVDRILDDSYTPLSQVTSPIAPGARAAIDAGLAVRAAARPQSIAVWRATFAGSSAEPAAAIQPGAAPATVVMRQPSAAQPIASKSERVRRPTLIAGIALSVAAVAAVAWFVVGPRTTPPAPATADSAAVARPPDKVQQELEEARQARQAAGEEASRLRAEAEARRKADEEAALRRKIEDEVRQKAEAEQAARQKAEEAAKAEAAKAEATKAEAAKAEADRARAEAQKADAQKKAPPPAQVATSSAAPGVGPSGGGQCDGSFRSQWCRGAYQGFPESCWYVPMTIRSGAISGQWTSQGATEPQTFNGQVAPDGTVSITYNGIGAQTFVGQHFTAVLNGSVAGGVLSAKGRAGAAGRDFSVRVQCR